LIGAFEDQLNVMYTGNVVNLTSSFEVE
jgi:hypothetical protein